MKHCVEGNSLSVNIDRLLGPKPGKEPKAIYENSNTAALIF